MKGKIFMSSSFVIKSLLGSFWNKYSNSWVIRNNDFTSEEIVFWVICCIWISIKSSIVFSSSAICKPSFVSSTSLEFGSVNLKNFQYCPNWVRTSLSCDRTKLASFSALNLFLACISFSRFFNSLLKSNPLLFFLNNLTTSHRMYGELYPLVGVPEVHCHLTSSLFNIEKYFSLNKNFLKFVIVAVPMLPFVL